MKLSILSYLRQRNGYTDEKENIPVKTIMEELGIKNKTQIDTWWRWGIVMARIIIV